MRRPASMLTTAGFLAVIAGVGVFQTAVELGGGRVPQALDVFAREPTAENLRAYESRLEESSVSARALRPWVQYAQFRLFENGEKTVVGRDGWLFYRPGVEYVTERPPAPKPEYGDPLAAILGFRSQLDARGIRLLVVPAPNKESVYPEKATRRAQGSEVLVAPQTRQLLSRLTTEGVEVVDLFEVFRRAKTDAGESAGRGLYLAQDTHWSPAGMELAARAVADRMIQRGWVARGRTAYSRRFAPLARVGDLVRMLQSRPIERSVEPENVACVQILDENGAPYKDDPQAEVLVLGDSFLRIYERDEPGSAGFAAHLAEDLNRPVASIVNDGGASTLVRQELARRPKLLAGKKVVVWEFVERDLRYGAEGWQTVPLPPIIANGREQRHGSERGLSPSKTGT